MLHVVETNYAKLASISNEEASQPVGEGEWSRKQIIGHLIDSACNNHQRFVRAQCCDELEFPSYQQDEWVDRQKCNLREWQELLELWRAYNKHLAHIIDVMDEENLQTPCIVSWRPQPIPLSGLIEHYLEHMESHLSQILP